MTASALATSGYQPLIHNFRSFSPGEQNVKTFFFQKYISMCDVSAFRDNFAKLNVRNLQKVPTRRHCNFGSELYGFIKFVKRIILVMSL